MSYLDNDVCYPDKQTWNARSTICKLTRAWRVIHHVGILVMETRD